MRILVLHRITNSLIRYQQGIDHEKHDVTYIGTAERLTTLPAGVRARRIERPGTDAPELEVVKAVGGEPRPDLVIALSEYDLLAAARVRQALGVPGAREIDVLLVRDKVSMKAAVERAGLRVPRFIPLAKALSDVTAVQWRGRTILKPLDGASSQDVAAFDTVAETLDSVRRDGLPAGTNIDSFEIEEFVSGPIIHVDGLVLDGRAVAVLASRYVGTCLGYAAGDPLGSVQVDTPPELVDWTLQCLAAVGVHTSLFHLEGIETPDGVVFLEVASRFGGADVVDTFELATGVHMPSMQLRILTEGQDARPDVRIAAADARYGWFVWPGHLLDADYCEVSGTEDLRSSPLTWRWVQRSPGEPIKRALSYSDTDVPLAGIVGPAPAPVLEQFLRDIFASARVDPADTAS
jgi:hypothetical protein